MATRWVVAVGSLGLAACVGVGTEASSARAVSDDRILPLTDLVGTLEGLDRGPTVARWTDGRFGGLTVSLPEPTEVVFTAAAGDVPGDPVLLVYGPRAAGSWSSRRAKVDAFDGPNERTGTLALEAGTYLVSVGDFERRGGEAAVGVERASRTVELDVHGWVFGRDEGSENTARQSWGAACDAWHSAARARLGENAAETGFTCGEPTDLDAASWTMLASEPVLHVRAALLADPRVLGARTVTGPGNGSMFTALDGWRQECAELESRLAALYGGRTLGVSCGKPVDVDASSSWFAYESTAAVTVAPARGTLVEATELVFGDGSGGDTSARQNFEDACDAWMDAVLMRAGTRLESAECAAPRDDDASASWAAYSGIGTARFLSPPGRQAAQTNIATIRGSGAGSDRGALAAWRSSCKTRLDALEQELGDLLIGATCGTPHDTDASSSWFVFESAPTVWLATQ